MTIQYVFCRYVFASWRVRVLLSLLIGTIFLTLAILIVPVRLTNQAAAPPPDPLVWAQSSGPASGRVVGLTSTGSTLYAATNYGGVYRSANQAQSWEGAGVTQVGSVLETIAAKGSTLFAAAFATGLSRSTDGGNTWQRINTGLSTQGIFFWPSTLAVSGNNVFVGANGDGVFRTANDGTNWVKVTTGLSDEYVNALAVAGTTIFAGTDGGLFRSTNQGDNWSAITPDFGSDIESLAVSGSTVFAGTFDKGVFVSLNEGQSWMQTNLKDKLVDALIVYDGKVFAATPDGVLLSSDNGTTWLPVNTGLGSLRVYSFGLHGTTLFAGTYSQGVFRYDSQTQSWAEANRNLTATTINTFTFSGATVFAGLDQAGVYRSTDQGKTWSASGLGGLFIKALANSGGTLLAGESSEGIFRSTDQGQTWAAANTGVTNKSIRSLFVGTSAIFAGTSGGAFRSTDQGQSWTAIGLTTTSVNGFISNANYLFAGTGNGVYRSTDNGQNWTAMNSGLASSGLTVRAFVVNGATIFAGTGGGVFRSADNGQTWTAANSGITGTLSVYGLVLNGTDLLVGTDGGGTFRSTDNGVSWTAENNGITGWGSYVRALAVNGPEVYLGSRGGAVFLTPPPTTVTCPTVTGITPTSGAVGASVTINGSGFTGVTAVKFTTTVAAQFTVNSDSQITTTVPTGTITGPITISKTGCPDGQTGIFTVTTPNIPVSISTTLTGATNTSLAVPILVEDLTGKAVTAYDFTLTFDPSVLQLQSTPLDATGTLSSGFSLTPNAATPGRLVVSAFGTTALSGAGLLLKLNFNVVGQPGAATPLTWQSFRFNEGTPAATTTNGSFMVSRNPAPTLISLSPNTATTGGAGFTLTMTGANFINGSVVRWNNSDRPTTFIGSTQLTAAIPATDLAAAGNASVSVFTPTPGGGTSAALSFTVTLPCSYAIAPTTQSLSSNAGNGTVNVTTGAGCNWTTNSNASWIKVTSGASGTGNGTVNYDVAANTGAARTGTITLAGQTFTINQAGATICHTVASLEPLSGTAGTEINITGANFTSVASVKFANNVAANFTILSDSHIRALVPNGALTGTLTLSQLGCGDVQTTIFNVSPGAASVVVSGRQLLVRQRNADGTLGTAAPFVIRGVDWSPASKDTASGDPAVRRGEFIKWYRTDIPLLKAMNANTVRLFLDPGAEANGLAVLDELYRNDIMAILTVDDANNDMGRVEQVVKFYRSHPAVLLWLLGNEWNINRYYNKFTNPYDAAIATERAAQLVKALDANHPVATSYGEININAEGLRLADTQVYVNQVCPSVDIWGVNIYRGNTFGNLFEQWQSISAKPMFIAEFGTDAFRSVSAATCPVGTVDEAMQADWDQSLWDDLFKNLSANDASKTALGGCAFEFNDEWWKVAPAGSQQTCGFSLPGGHPDGFANEEYFGLVDIDRKPRRAYERLKMAFDPAYQPAMAMQFRAVSRGAAAQEYPFQNGVAIFFKNGAIFHRKEGGAGGGRGFNIAAIDPATGALLQPVQIFDTWGTRGTGVEMRRMIDFLNGLPNGTLLLIAVADEAGLNLDNSCTFLNSQWTADGLRALEGLGSKTISSYCFRDSFAMVAVKGKPEMTQDKVGKGVEVDAATTSAAMTNQVACVNAASYKLDSVLAPDSIVSAFGADLSNVDAGQGAPPGPLPTSLNGTTVKIKDSAGVEQVAPLFYVAKTQINYLMPASVALGSATVTVTNGAGKTTTGTVQLAMVAPGIFSANSDGKGPVIGSAIRVKNGIIIGEESLARYHTTLQKFVGVPLDVSRADERVVIQIYGTGLRKRSSLANVFATLGGVSTTVDYAGMQPSFAGLDQVNIVVPNSLSGRGELEIVIIVEGQSANIVTLTIK